MLPPERELAKLLQVSRTSVREALIVLEVNGLIRIKVGSGAEVCAVPGHAFEVVSGDVSSERSPLEQLSARALVEGQIAGLAAERITQDQLDKLKLAVADMAKVPQTDWEAYLKADFSFHSILALASGNMVLRDIQEYLWALRRQQTFQHFEEHFTRSAEEQRATVNEHLAVFQAVKAHDVSAATQAMHKHLEQVAERFIK